MGKPGLFGVTLYLRGMEYDDVARAVARKYATSEIPFEDLYQEARVAIWRAGERDEMTASRAYLTAKHRCLRVLEQRQLGSERPKGRPPGKNGVKPVKTFLTFDGVIYDDAAQVEPDHAGEVARRVDVERALETLTPEERALVRALYWEDMTWEQAREYLGKTPQAHWRSARDKLRRALGEPEPAGE